MRTFTSLAMLLLLAATAQAQSSSYYQSSGTIIEGASPFVRSGAYRPAAGQAATAPAQSPASAPAEYPAPPAAPTYVPVTYNAPVYAVPTYAAPTPAQPVAAAATQTAPLYESEPMKEDLLAGTHSVMVTSVRTLSGSSSSVAQHPTPAVQPVAQAQHLVPVSDEGWRSVGTNDPGTTTSTNFTTGTTKVVSGGAMPVTMRPVSSSTTAQTAQRAVYYPVQQAGGQAMQYVLQPVPQTTAPTTAAQPVALQPVAAQPIQYVIAQPAQYGVQPVQNVSLQPVPQGTVQMASATTAYNPCCVPTTTYVAATPDPCCTPYYGGAAATAPMLPAVPAPPVTTSPPVVGSSSYRPLIPRSMPAPIEIGQGIFGQPRAYVSDQPVRNFFRYLLP